MSVYLESTNILTLFPEWIYRLQKDFVRKLLIYNRMNLVSGHGFPVHIATRDVE